MLAPVMATSSAMSVLLPSLNRARETAMRVQSASNLRQIGLAITLYSTDHKGEMPANLEAVKGPYLQSDKVLDSPLGDADGGDYVYLGHEGLKINKLGNAGELAIAYDAAALEEGEGTNVLFLDGHVEWLDGVMSHRTIDASRQKLATRD